MAMDLWFIGIAVPERRKGMFYVEPLKLWINNPDADPYHFQYYYLEDDSPWPQLLKGAPHVGYRVDNIEKACKAAQEVLYGPVAVGKDKLAFVRQNGIFLQFYQIGK